MVKIRLGNVNLVIDGQLPSNVFDIIRKTLSYVIPGHKFMPRYKQDQLLSKFSGKEPWDGTKTVTKVVSNGLKAPSGLLYYIREILKENGIEYQILDERPSEIKTPGWSIDGLILRDYQLEAVTNGLNRKRGVMEAATGSGKTEMSTYMIASAASFPSIFYVNSCDLLEQTYDRFKKYIRYNGNEVKIGRIGAGHFDVGDINIITVQTAERSLCGSYSKYSFDDIDIDDNTNLDQKQKSILNDLIKSSQFVICDECHHVSCNTIQNILNNSFSAKYRFGASASPWRDDGLDILIEASFGRKFCSISASFLIKKGYLVKPIITFNHFRQSLGPAGNFNSHYTKYVVENEARNNWIAQEALKQIEKNMPTIILVKWIKHADILYKLIGKCEVLAGSGELKKNPKLRKDILDKMRSRETMCIIATTLLDEGVDVPAASVGIFAGGGKSSTRELQRVGRFIRTDSEDKNKTNAYIEEFMDHTKWLSHHAKNRRRILETEPLFEIRDNSASLKL